MDICFLQWDSWGSSFQRSVIYSMDVGAACGGAHIHTICDELARTSESSNLLPPPNPTALVVPPTTPPLAGPSSRGLCVEAARARRVRDQNRHLLRCG